MFFQRIIFIILIVFSVNSFSASLSYYLPASHSYDESVVKPSETLGFTVGERHIRHDQLVEYLTTLSSQSDRVKIEEIGRTYQYRKQLLLTVSSPKNLANLEQILADRASGKSDEKAPVVVWLGYSVHGDEISGANAALVVAYHLAASQNEDVLKMLDEMIIVIEPSINPDGMDRFANWVATYRSTADNADPNHIEHHQNWPTGRTNHYWFDLNRDWLLLSQQESVNRLKAYHQYKPNVLGDFHEMGANGSYFFQPGIPSRTNPITPLKNIELTQKIAQFHAKALDAEQRLYYSEENFDDFYYGKGSTYPDVNGAVGILFEQASSRGYQQDTINGLLTFEFGIKNHVLTSFSTLHGSWQLKNELRDYRKNFYQSAFKEAKKEKFSGYIVSEPKDEARLALFLDKLSQHQIKAYPLTDDFRLKERIYPAKTSFYIPLAQPQFKLIKALFTQQKNFKDNTFYDVSGWTLPLAMNINFSEVDRTWGLKLDKTTWQRSQKKTQHFESSSYAYAVEWHHYYAPKLLNNLLSQNIKVKVATKPFSSVIEGKNRDFSAGTLLIPAGIQTSESWRITLREQSNSQQIPTFAINTGLTPTGIDLGSNSFKLINPVNVLMVGGKGISQYEAGEIRYYLDQQLAIPVSVVEHNRFHKIDLTNYSHIILVDGNYSVLNKSITSKLINWVRKGGVIFGQKRGAKWLADKELLKTKFASKSQLNQLFEHEGLTYQDKEVLAGRKRIAGAIFSTKVDITHPLMYGYSDTNLPVFKNSTLIMDKPKIPFAIVAQYPNSALLSGYTDINLVNRLANSTAIMAHNVSKGRVIATSENLTFRGYWQGTAKILANSLFFAKAFNVSEKP